MLAAWCRLLRGSACVVVLLAMLLCQGLQAGLAAAGVYALQWLPALCSLLCIVAKWHDLQCLAATAGSLTLCWQRGVAVAHHYATATPGVARSDTDDQPDLNMTS
jgi:hypothetical protein